MSGSLGQALSRVVVVGGGLAGISAALELASAGCEVTLLEARPRLGGAASSSRRGDLAIDTGQHVFLRCCTSYRGLLDRLGVTGSVSLQGRFDVSVLSAAGQARLRRSAMPSPLHLAGALARYRLLSPADRLRIARAAVALRSVDPADPATDGVRLGDWLAAHGQGERSRRRLWDLFVVSGLNIAGDEASLALAAMVIQTALLGARDAADIGIATVPLGELHHAAPAALLRRLGARVLLGTKVTAVEPGFRVVAGDEEWPADGVVLAVPPEAAARLAGAAGLADTARLAGLGSSPIVNVHVIYDRQVTDLPFAAVLDSPVQWVFDKTAQSGLTSGGGTPGVAPRGGQYLAISLSAANEWIDIPAARLREVFVPELGQLLPAAASARVTDFFVTRERRATFRQAPGTAELRPGNATSMPGLVLAGAWTRTGWPDTMEGAVRSGENAARELTGQLGGQGQRAPTTAGAQQ